MKTYEIVNQLMQTGAFYELDEDQLDAMFKLVYKELKEELGDDGYYVDEDNKVMEMDDAYDVFISKYYVREATKDEIRINNILDKIREQCSIAREKAKAKPRKKGFWDKVPYNEPHVCTWCGKPCEEILRWGIDVPMWQCGSEECGDNLMRLWYKCNR